MEGGAIAPTVHHVLLVADNPKVRAYVCRLLAKEHDNYNVVEAEGVAEGVAALERQRCEVVLLDLDCPDGGVAGIHRFSNEPLRMPVIALAYDDSRSASAVAIREGAQDYLIKGRFGGDVLSRTIRYARDRHVTLQRLHRREQQFMELVRNHVDAIIVVDREGVVRYANPASAVLFRGGAERAVGTQFGHAMVTGDSTTIEVLVEGRPVAGELRVVDIEWDGEPAQLAAFRLDH